jgi:hypothetical protein
MNKKVYPLAVLAVAVFTTISSISYGSIPAAYADRNGDCSNTPEDPSLSCSGGGALIGEPGGAGGRQECDSDGECTFAGGVGGRHIDDRAGFRCEFEDGSRECVGSIDD